MAEFDVPVLSGEKIIYFEQHKDSLIYITSDGSIKKLNEKQELQITEL